MKLLAVLIVAIPMWAQTRVNPGQVGPLVASAASITLPTPSGQYAGSTWFGITGTTTVTSVSGPFTNEQGSLTTLNGAVQFSAGSTIGATCTTTAGLIYAWYFDGIQFWVVGPGCTTKPTGQGYQLPATGTVATTVALKLNSFYEAVADFGADPLNVSNSTAAIQAGITAAAASATTTGTCLHIVAGKYRLTSALAVPSNGCVKGDGPNQTIIMQATAGATIMTVTGHNAVLRDFFLAMESAITATASTGLSLYPNVASTTGVVQTSVYNVSIASQWCNEDPTNACQVAANANRLLYGVLVQSGVKDNLFNSFIGLSVRWATESVYLLSGGLAGSSGGGAVNAQYFTNLFASDATDCLKLGGSGENYFIASECTNASHAAVTFASNAFGGTYNAAASSHNYVQLMGESNTALADFTVANTNTVSFQGDEDSSGSTGNIKILGSQQNRNQVSAPGIFKSGFYNLTANSINPFICAGMIDDLATPCTATVDFSKTTNNPAIMRIRNPAVSSDPAYDFYNLTSTAGHFFRDSVDEAITLPVATFQKEFTSGTSTNVFTRFVVGVGAGTALGDVNFRFVNSGVSSVSEFAPGVMLNVNTGTEVYPFTIRGDGTVTYPVSGFSSGNVVCYKASGVLGYAVVTAGAVGSCN